MEKNYFLKLLEKYVKGEATAEERDFLISYYNLFQNEPDVVALLNDESRTALKEEIRASIWDNIAKEDYQVEREGHLKIWYNRLSVASIIIAICSIGVFFRADLVRLVEPEMVTVRNDKNVEFPIRLPDGSRVILGVGSKIDYSSSFAHKPKRDVYLTGNAFFDVTHDKQKPFSVYSGDVKTTVLGTAFSIEAFPWNTDVTVTVKRGKVRVSDKYKIQGVITPNHQIKYNKNKSISSQQKVDANHYDKWKSQTLSFDDVQFAEAAKVLEHRFNVKIVFAEDDLKSKRFTAAFNSEKSLESILKSICDFNEAIYSYLKDKGLILIKSANKPKTINL